MFMSNKEFAIILAKISLPLIIEEFKKKYNLIILKSNNFSKFITKIKINFNFLFDFSFRFNIVLSGCKVIQPFKESTLFPR